MFWPGGVRTLVKPWKQGQLRKENVKKARAETRRRQIFILKRIILITSSHLRLGESKNFRRSNGKLNNLRLRTRVAKGTNACANEGCERNKITYEFKISFWRRFTHLPCRGQCINRLDDPEEVVVCLPLPHTNIGVGIFSLKIVL